VKRIQQALELSRRESAARPPEPIRVETPTPLQRPSLQRRRPLQPITAQVCQRNRLKLGTEVDAVAEAYRVVRSRVLLWLDTHKRSTVAMVSAAADEGKTLSAINLAFSIAQDTNHTVLLVDFDLRSPSVHAMLELDARQGLESYFAGSAALEDLIVPVAFPRMAVLPCLTPVNAPSELLSGSIVRGLVEELRTRYPDRVILFDLPPALVSDDALVFLPLVDAALVVIGDGTTRKDQLAQLAQVVGDVPVIGSVLNRAKSRPLQSYYR
jgi:Mrp family chromosome partitioning ATPase